MRRHSIVTDSSRELVGGGDAGFPLHQLPNVLGAAPGLDHVPIVQVAHSWSSGWVSGHRQRD